jgi:hypothetical protein
MALEAVVADFARTRWGRRLAYGEIAVDDLNHTFVARASIVLADGIRFALSGLEEPLPLRDGTAFKLVLLTMVSCKRSCFEPDWCAHPREAAPKLAVIGRELIDRIRLAEH